MTRGKSNHQEEALGCSDAFVTFQERLSRAAAVDRSVLIIGERGTGKELAATRLHYLSPRWSEPLVTLNCAAMAPTLIATELFGHEAGAFTGAVKRRAGRFETAHRGTLFLDEIGGIPIEAQEKILRVVEYGSFERVGSSLPVQVDVRIIGATHVDLPDLISAGRFKRDLLDRLSFEVLFLPPLRERKEDIALLARHFAARMAFELQRPAAPELTEETITQLESYPWPGNIRELKNVVERAVYLSKNNRIRKIEFDPFHSPFARETEPRAPAPPPISETGLLEKALPEAIRDLEIAMLRKALTRSRYNQKQAAQLMGLTYHQFRGLYRKHADAIRNVRDINPR
jgi:psp operon transcriptional activator